MILEEAKNGLSALMRKTITELYVPFLELERRIGFFDKEIDTVFTQCEACQRIAKVKGIGPKIATAVIVAMGKGTEFKHGRHFAAWPGSASAHERRPTGAHEHDEKRRQAS